MQWSAEAGQPPELELLDELELLELQPPQLRIFTVSRPTASYWKHVMVPAESTAFCRFPALSNEFVETRQVAEEEGGVDGRVNVDPPLVP